jgi:hypothetical protein
MYDTNYFTQRALRKTTYAKELLLSHKEYCEK